MVKAPDLDRAARLREARAKRYANSVDAARALGLVEATYHGHENGFRGIKADAAALYARRFDVRFEWLMLGVGPRDNNSVTKPDSRNHSLLYGLEQYRQDVPLIRPAKNGSKGDVFTMSTAEDFARRLPGIAESGNAFAIYMQGSSMFPRFNADDLVYVDPARVVRVGDDVLIELKPEKPGANATAMIRRLVSRSATTITLRQFSPDGETSIDTDKVQRISKILTTADLAGV